MEDQIQQARRAAFETWATRQHGGLSRRDDGEYFDDLTHGAWLGFNAALDCVVIEFPELCRQVTIDDESIDIYWPDEVRAAIESTNLGIKVK
jgi:hypothetical protein